MIGKLKPVGEQVVALMGASSGIGRETALQFAREGARVVVSARSEEGLNSLADEIRSEGGEVTCPGSPSSRSSRRSHPKSSGGSSRSTSWDRPTARWRRCRT
jgi:NAD(P)-dependent dehydrogenase (short-subunit alcohol dehydrogenase family)